MSNQPLFDGAAVTARLLRDERARRWYLIPGGVARQYLISRGFRAEASKRGDSFPSAWVRNDLYKMMIMLAANVLGILIWYMIGFRTLSITEMISAVAIGHVFMCYVTRVLVMLTRNDRGEFWEKTMQLVTSIALGFLGAICVTSLTVGYGLPGFAVCVLVAAILLWPSKARKDLH